MKRAPQAPPRSLRRPLLLIGLVALGFAAVAALLLSWDRWFPLPPEQQVEVVWTHGCPCARDWMETLRQDGFTVRDFDLLDLSSTRRHWQVPAAATGCHPGRFLGYVLDGHVPGALLRRLAKERPRAVALMQVRSANPQDLRFELLQQDGSRRAWP